jgi:hypothetical protein
MQSEKVYAPRAADRCRNNPAAAKTAIFLVMDRGKAQGRHIQIRFYTGRGNTAQNT